MGRLLLTGNPPIEITLRRSARARRLSLRISQLDGRVTLTLPKRVSEAEGRAFAMEKQDWIAGHLSKQPAQRAIGVGSVLPIEGKSTHVIAGTGRRIILGDSTLAVPGSPETAPRRVQAFLKELARDRLAAASDHYAQLLGRPYSKLTLRDTRSRWGSCSSAGALMYSWRLILAPPEVLAYVAAHEVAHLQHMDHSAAFWQVVEQLYGDPRAQRRWLRSKGLHLHSYRFDTA